MLIVRKAQIRAQQRPAAVGVAQELAATVIDKEPAARAVDNVGRATHAVVIIRDRRRAVGVSGGEDFTDTIRVIGRDNPARPGARAHPAGRSVTIEWAFAVVVDLVGEETAIAVVFPNGGGLAGIR